MLLNLLPEVLQQALQGSNGARCKRTIGAPEMLAYFFQQGNKIFAALTVFKSPQQIPNIRQPFPAGGAPAARLSGKKLG